MACVFNIHVKQVSPFLLEPNATPHTTQQPTSSPRSRLRLRLRRLCSPLLRLLPWASAARGGEYVDVGAKPPEGETDGDREEPGAVMCI